jgi:hypothetical protein
MRLRLVPGSTTKIFGIGSSSLYALEFDASGNLLNVNYDYASYSADYHSFQVFPDGQHFITSDYGSIYTSSLSYLLQLPHGDYEYSDFTFDQNASKIIAACRNYKCFVAYANPGYTELKTYNTVGYPVFIFYDNNSIISLSSTIPFDYYEYNYNFLIESIPLNKQGSHQ